MSTIAVKGFGVAGHSLKWTGKNEVRGSTDVHLNYTAWMRYYGRVRIPSDRGLT